MGWGEAEPIMEGCFGICLQANGESGLWSASPVLTSQGEQWGRDAHRPGWDSHTG